MDCSVCVEPFNKSTRKHLPCPTCDFQVCSACFETHQTNQSGMFELACMSCKQPWEDQHVREHVSRALVKRLSQSTQKRLREEEIAFMPETQMYVEYGRGVETTKVGEYLQKIRNVNELELELATHEISTKKNDTKFKSNLKNEQRTLRHNASHIRINISRWRNGMHLSRAFKDIIPDPLYSKEFGSQQQAGANDLVDKESHVMCPCPADDCRGFVTRRNHQCGVCGMKVCHKCLQTNDDAHVCQEENVQSADLILATTKPCPKCASRIHKIEGCDQMWCTNCNTPFSWKTGKEITGQTIHNPHFYEWTRQNSSRRPLQQAEIDNCEGLPEYQHVIRHTDVVFRQITTSTNTFVRMVSSVHRKCVHFREVETQNIDIRFRTNLDVRVKWLQNVLTDTQFEKALLRRHNQRVVRQRTNQVYSLVVTLCSDVFHRLLRENENTVHVQESYTTEFREIFNYANTCFCKLERMYKVSLKRIFI